ncbi:MAG TPA: protein-L-isoaspartate(D-aspartate) O-methyltransferase [Candidatus Acidoferrum sp.]|nr:protein-L-isoaspartate(D-aspartate) O-methyltransferase [Candidatus Acidoferrum sp.]
MKSSDSIPQDYLRAREKMVEEQIVARGIKNPRLLAAMRKLPRHLFVDPGLLQRAYDDSSLPIGEKQTVSQPYMAARMTEALELSGEEKVLEIGTGSGYQTALLAELSFNVFSVEKIRTLAMKARALLDRLQYHNIAIQVGDGSIGWPEHSPFDAIIVTAGAPDLPRPLLDQLAIGGRLVIPVGDDESQVLVRVMRHASKFEEEQLGDCRFVKLWGKFGWQE